MRTTVSADVDLVSIVVPPTVTRTSTGSATPNRDHVTPHPVGPSATPAANAHRRGERLLRRVFGQERIPKRRRNPARPSHGARRERSNRSRPPAHLPIKACRRQKRSALPRPSSKSLADVAPGRSNRSNSESECERSSATRIHTVGRDRRVTTGASNLRRPCRRSRCHASC